MASYVEIVDTQLDPDAPLTSQLGYQFRDNPEAMFEGDPSAPKLQGLAAADEGRGLPVLTVSAADTVAVDRGAGSVAGTSSTVALAVAHTYTIITYTGSMRFQANHFTSDAGFASNLSLYKNDVLVNSWSTTSITPITRSEDVTVVPTDVIEWRHSGNTSLFANAIVKASDGYVIQHLYARFGGL